MNYKNVYDIIVTNAKNNESLINKEIEINKLLIELNS